MKKLVLLLVLVSVPLFAQDNKPRVFVTDSQSWEVGGGSGGADGTFGGAGGGGARPQTAEIIKTFGERCPNVMVNNIKGKADYIVLLDHEGGKSFANHKNKVAVFERVSGDSVVSKSTYSLGGSVQTACEAITKHWSDNASRLSQARKQDPKHMIARPLELVKSSPKLSVSSTPDGADIEIDGSFMGNTPSAIELTAGDHDVTIKKSGYKAWHRTLKVSGGDINLAAQLEKETAQ